MTPEEFTDWIVLAKDQEAVRLHVKRGTKPGQKDTAVLFLDLELVGLDVARCLTRMRDDVRGRRLTQAMFTVHAMGADGKPLLTDRVNVTRDAEIPGSADPATSEEPGVAIARMGFGAAQDAYAQMRQMAEGQATFLTAVSSVVKGMGEGQQTANTRNEELMLRLFEIFSLKQERDAEIVASQERRELGKSLFQTLGPIAGMLMSQMAKNAAPVWGGLIQSLISDQERFVAFMSLLKPEEVIALEKAMNMTFPKPETKEEPKP